MAETTNLLTKVADLSGTASSADRVETWLLDGARQIARYGKLAGKIGEFTNISSTLVGAGSGGGAIDGKYEIIEVTRGTASTPKICRYIDHNAWVRASDSTSIYYENNDATPVYTIASDASNSKIYVKPDPAATTGIVNVRFIPGWAIHSGGAYIEQFPRKYLYLCVYYAAIHNLGRKLLDATITVPAFAVSPTPPAVSAPPADLDITATLPVAPAMSEKSVSITGTAPTYTAPVLSITNFPTITALDIGAIIPVAPALSSTTIIETGLTNPTFTPPVMNNLDFGNTTGTEFWITTEEDPEMSAARVQEIQAKIGEYSSKMAESQAQFSKESAILNKDLQIALENARMSNSEDAEKLQKYSAELQSYQAQVGAETQEWKLNYDTDIAAWSQENSLNLQKYQADIQNSLNTFNEESSQYQALLQKDLQDAQLKESKEGRDLQKYSQEVQGYTASVGTTVQEYAQNFSKWQADNALDLQRYQSELAQHQADQQNVQAKFAANVQTYQAEVAGLQTKLQQCQAMYQEAIQLEFQVSLQADVLDKQGA